MGRGLISASTIPQNGNRGWGGGVLISASAVLPHRRETWRWVWVGVGGVVGEEQLYGKKAKLEKRVDYLRAICADRKRGGQWMSGSWATRHQRRLISFRPNSSLPDSPHPVSSTSPAGLGWAGNWLTGSAPLPLVWRWLDGTARHAPLCTANKVQ